MIPAMISSAVIFFLYWRQRNETKPPSTGRATMADVRRELSNLNVRLDALKTRADAR